MNQRGRAEKDLLQVGRDYNYSHSSLLNVNLANQCSKDRKPSLFSRIIKWLRNWLEKDRVIAECKKQVYELQRSHTGLKQELQKTKRGLEEVKKRVDRLVREGTENTYPNDDLLEVLQLLIQLNSDQKAAEPYENAAFWIEPRLSKWTEEAIKSVTSESPEDFSAKNIESFHADLTAYMEWFQQSMILAHPLRGELSELNQKRCLKQPQPYREAISHIFLKVSIHDVDEEEYQAIHQMSSYLRKHL